LFSAVLFVSSAFSTILPTGYTHIEYIELNHAYIDTGIVLDTAQKINTMKLHYTVANVAWEDIGHSNHLFGCRTNVNGTNKDVILYTGSEYIGDVFTATCFAIKFGTVVWRLDASSYPKLLNRYRYDIDNLQEKITDVETNTILGTNTATAADWGCTTDLRINGLKGHAKSQYADSWNIVRVYDFEIEGIAHMIPAKRNTDGVVGMYDIIRNQFYTQTSTTGYNNPAVAGPEVGIIGDTCTYATIMGENICLIDTQPSGSYLPVKYNNNKYYLMLDATHDYPIHKNSDNKLKVIVGNTTYNAHDTSVN